MGSTEKAAWGVIGAIVGAFLMNKLAPQWSLLGAIGGAVIGYIFGKWA